MPLEIVLATRNKNKAKEIERLLSGMDVVILTLEDFPSCPEVEEDQSTFEGNAVKKASVVAQCTGRMAISDDSGLEVYALAGAPGIISARYAGENADDHANIEKLLHEMKHLREGQRGARFVCYIALAFPHGGHAKFWGSVEGTIGSMPRGGMGFGYDPLFYPEVPEGQGRTFAEMSPEEKDALSHRGVALRKLRDYLKSFIFKADTAKTVYTPPKNRL